MFCDEFPVIDCSPLLAKDGEEGIATQREATLKQIRCALEKRGFFYAAGFKELTSDYIEHVYSYTRKAHALPTSVKARWTRPNGGSYSGPDIGEDEPKYISSETSNVRAWDYRRDSSGKQGGHTAYAYPGDDILQPNFAHFCDSLYERQEEIKKVMLVAMAEIFGLESDTFSQYVPQDLGEMRLLHYPGHDGVADAGISAHTDAEFLTLMHQDASGLQLIPRDTGEWIDAPVRPGEFIVIVGDMLERFTNGLLASTPHRVVLSPHVRHSIIRFFAMHPDTEIRPLPPFLTEGRLPKYKAVTAEQYLAQTEKDLEDGKGCWDPENKTSLTATRDYD